MKKLFKKTLSTIGLFATGFFTSQLVSNGFNEGMMGCLIVSIMLLMISIFADDII